MSAPAPPVVLRWTPVRADFDDALAIYRSELGGWAVAYPYVMAGLFLFVGLACLVIGLLVPALLTAVGAVVLVLVYQRATSRNLWKNPLVRRPQEAVVSTFALRMSNTTASTQWQWPTFSHAVETPRSFVLIGARVPGEGRSGTRLFSYLPKGALPHPAEVDRLRALLASVLPGGVRAR
jgi:hypothetical protein